MATVRAPPPRTGVLRTAVEPLTLQWLCGDGYVGSLGALLSLASRFDRALLRAVCHGAGSRAHLDRPPAARLFVTARAGVRRGRGVNVAPLGSAEAPGLSSLLDQLFPL